MARSLAGGDALSCPDGATGRDPAAGGSQRLPARTGGQDRGRPRPPADLVRPARSRAARARPARRAASPSGTGPTASRRSWLGSGGSGSITARAAAGLAVHRSSDPGPLDHHVPVARSRASADDCRGRARPRRARRLAVPHGAADRRPGATADARWTERIDEARGDAADLGPRRRPPDARRVDLGDERQEHGHAARSPTS